MLTIEIFKVAVFRLDKHTICTKKSPPKQSREFEFVIGRHILT